MQASTVKRLGGLLNLLLLDPCIQIRVSLYGLVSFPIENLAFRNFDIAGLGHVGDRVWVESFGWGPG